MRRRRRTRRKQSGKRASLRCLKAGRRGAESWGPATCVCSTRGVCMRGVRTRRRRRACSSTAPSSRPRMRGRALARCSKLCGEGTRLRTGGSGLRDVSSMQC
eukprot:2277250-Rhodomonas_salina.1